MFGQIILGLANSGKTTYCSKMAEYLSNQGRKIKIINLDPGVEELPYKCDVDIRDLICIDEVMKKENLGPNESLVRAMEFLYVNIEWLERKMSKLSNDSYLIIDLPGQVELYTQHVTLSNILTHLTNPNGLNYCLTSVFLAESIYCQTPESYIQILVSTLSSMMNIALPRVNILSKSKLLDRDNLPFRAADIRQINYLDFLVDHIKGCKNSRKKEYYRNIVDMIIDNPWLGFNFFDYEKENDFKKVIEQIDAANGYIVKQKFLSQNDNKNIEAEMELDKASEDLVDALF